MLLNRLPILLALRALALFPTIWKCALSPQSSALFVFPSHPIDLIPKNCIETRHFSRPSPHLLVNLSPNSQFLPTNQVEERR